MVESNIDWDTYEYYGLRVMDDPVVGETLAPSYRWEDGDCTDEELNGTSAIQVSESTFDRALRSSNGYWGTHVALIGGYQMEYGEDAGEVVIRDAVVVAVWERSTTTSF